MIHDSYDPPLHELPENDDGAENVVPKYVLSQLPQSRISDILSTT